MDGFELIKKAARFAQSAHSGQLRKYTNDPYILHPARVAAMTTLLYGSTAEMVAAAWLHDVIEDCSIDAPWLRSEGFPSAVIALVEWLTNTSKKIKPELNRENRKKMDRERIANAPNIAKEIKALDRIDNLREMRDAPTDFILIYTEESRDLVDAIGNSNDALWHQVYRECDKLQEIIKSRSSIPEPL